MSNFTISGVVFTEDPHGYHKDGKEYSGVTSLIHAVKHLGVYPNASEYTKRVIIPKAGAYGTSIHNAIEFYDSTGIKKTLWATDYGDFEVSSELDTYIKLKTDGGYENIENEFNVAYGDYSSNIDNIWSKDGIYLVDTKTNNLDYYPEGEQGLKEYLMWQLNCYRVMFEAQTGEKVKGLLANWIRKGDGATWEIPIIDDESVIELLNTKWERNEEGIRYYKVEGGEKVYYEEDDVKNAVISTQGKLTIPQDLIEHFKFIYSEMERYKDEYEKMKTSLFTAMKECDVKSWDCGVFKATIVPETTSSQFDKDKFFSLHPELRNEALDCVKNIKRKASIRLTF